MAPVMFFFVMLEWFIAHRQHRHLYDKKETIGSTLVGIGNVVIAGSLKLMIFYLFVWIYNLVPWRIPFSWWTLLPCYVLWDFCSYWAHRISHQKRFFWATHIVHHTGENYNLTVSFRLSWIQHLKLIFFLPVSFLGFHPVILFIVNQIAVLFQFWVHTEYIRRMPAIIEYLFATPSNHRVHHGSQEKYIDKNYGATFIIWDRMFNTFQPEEEQVIYGITHPLERKSDPFYLNFHELKDIVYDVRTAKSWKMKMFFLFGAPRAVSDYKKSRERKPEILQTEEALS